MTTQPLTRLLWKEYRSQRSVWLALVVGTVLLQLVYYTFTRETRAEWEFYPVWVAAVLTGCYLAASAALLFAGEREEETNRLLQVLPLRPATLATAKLLFCLASTVLFALAVALLTVLLFSHLLSAEGETGIRLSTLGVFLSILGIMMLASLLVRHVLSALALGGVGLTAAGVAVIGVKDLLNLPDSMSLVLGLPVGVLACAAAVAIVPRWLSGDPIPWQRLVELVRWRDGNWIGRFWQRTLRWSASRATPVTRAFSVLIWKEARSAGRFLVLWSALAAVTAGLTFLNPINLGIAMLLLLLLLFMAPLIAGIRSFASDQSHKSMAFLGDRGVSPVAVWAVKLTVWSTCAALLVLLLGALTAGQQEVAASEGVGVFDLRDISFVQNPLARHLPFRVSVASWWGIGLSLFASLFALGQLLSLWVRRTIVATVVGMAGGGVIVAWHMFCTQTVGIPLWVSIWPLTISALLATLFTTAGWLRQERTWRRFGGQCAWVILPVAATWLAIEAQRVWSIPDVGPGFDWRKHEAQMENYDRSLSGQWAEFLAGPIDSRPTSPEKSRLVAEELGRLVAATREAGFPRLDPRVLLRDRAGISLERQLGIAWTAARRETREGSLEESWSYTKSILSAVEYLSSQISKEREWTTITSSRSATASILQEWSQAPGQTPEFLAQAAEFLNSQPIQLPRTELVRNQYVADRQSLEERGWGWEEQLNTQPMMEVAVSFPLSLVTTAERWRALRMLNVITRRREDEIRQHPTGAFTATYIGMGGSWVWNSPANSADQNVSKTSLWFATTPFLAGCFSAYQNLRNDYWPSWSWTQPDSSAAVDFAAAKVIVALERYRLAHGTYPEFLSQLVGEFLESLPADPSNSGDFGYAPLGLPHPLVYTRETMESPIPAGQPLLWSEGSGRTRLRFTTSIPPRPGLPNDQEPVWLTKNPEGVYWIGGWLPTNNLPYLGPRERTDHVLFIRLAH